MRKLVLFLQIWPHAKPSRIQLIKSSNQVIQDHDRLKSRTFTRISSNFYNEKHTCIESVLNHIYSCINLMHNETNSYYMNGHSTLILSIILANFRSLCTLTFFKYLSSHLVTFSEFWSELFIKSFWRRGDFFFIIPLSMLKGDNSYCLIVSIQSYLCVVYFAKPECMTFRTTWHMNLGPPRNQVSRNQCINPLSYLLNTNKRLGSKFYGDYNRHRKKTGE